MQDFADALCTAAALIVRLGDLLDASFSSRDPSEA
jgi:hypothetical protein